MSFMPEDSIWRKFWYPALVILFIEFLLLISYGMYLDEKRRACLIAQCLADGRKAYECEAMFRPLNR